MTGFDTKVSGQARHCCGLGFKSPHLHHFNNKKEKMSKQKTEGGQGGKKGHSNMVHYDYTEVVKAEAKRRRRQEDKKVIKEHLKDFE